MSGFVYLVGAGPGDPELITLKGMRCLERCEVVVYDALAPPALLDYCPSDAARIYVGKRQGRHALPQAEIDALLVRQAQAGRLVVRLKGGDPFVFGRGYEEVLALRGAGIPYEVVPGVTAGVAVPASAGIPVTHRGTARAVTFATGHPAATGDGTDFVELARVPGTLVVFMGLGSLREISAGLIAGGKSPNEPAAVIAEGTTQSQRTVVGTIGTIAEDVRRAALPSPALLVVGDVVALPQRLLAAAAE